MTKAGNGVLPRSSLRRPAPSGHATTGAIGRPGLQPGRTDFATVPRQTRNNVTAVEQSSVTAGRRKVKRRQNGAAAHGQDGEAPGDERKASPAAQQVARAPVASSRGRSTSPPSSTRRRGSDDVQDEHLG